MTKASQIRRNSRIAGAIVGLCVWTALSGVGGMSGPAGFLVGLAAGWMLSSVVIWATAEGAGVDEASLPGDGEAEGLPGWILVIGVIGLLVWIGLSGIGGLSGLAGFLFAAMTVGALVAIVLWSGQGGEAAPALPAPLADAPALPEAAQGHADTHVAPVEGAPFDDDGDDDEDSADWDDADEDEDADDDDSGQGEAVPEALTPLEAPQHPQVMDAEAIRLREKEAKRARKAEKAEKAEKKDKKAKKDKKDKKDKKPRRTALDDSAQAGARVATLTGNAPSDDLKRIKGIGPVLEQALHDAGVTTFAQIAAWDAARIDAMTEALGAQGGRIRSDDWVGQARVLAAGGETAFSRRVEAGEVYQQ